MESYFIGKIVLTVIYGMVLGLISSIPVGAVQLEVIKKSINGHIKPAIATAAGSASSDLLYGFLTLFGFGSFLMHKDCQIAIYSLGIVILSFLLYKSIRERHYMEYKESRVEYRKRLSFLTGFSIAISNPGMIIWWIVGFKLYLDLGIFEHVTAGIKTIFIISGCMGLGGYLVLIASILHRVQKGLSEKFLYRANTVLIFLLFILIGYFSVKLVCMILNVHFGL